MNKRVLFVDDEFLILSSMLRNLRGKFDIKVAQSGHEALEKLRAGPEFGVIVSDFKMPEMNGIEFLIECRKISPDSVRIMLTGQADMKLAVNAVNQGNIYQFLTKPIPPEPLESVLKSALEHYRLIESERELLHNTLKGSVKVLIDVLSMTNPTAFGQAARLRSLAHSVAEKAGLQNMWEVELTALLSMLGCVTVPEEILIRKNRLLPLTEPEMELYNTHVNIGSKLVANIPRLRDISSGIAFQNRRFDGSDAPDDGLSGTDIPILGRLLKVIIDYDEFASMGMMGEQSIDMMRKRQEWYDPQLLLALENHVVGAQGNYTLQLALIEDLDEGMVVEEPITDEYGRILVTPKMELTELIIQQVKNYNRIGRIKQPIKVSVRNDSNALD